MDVELYLYTRILYILPKIFSKMVHANSYINTYYRDVDSQLSTRLK